MAIAGKLRATALLLGDIVVLYAALLLTLFIRTGENWYHQLVDVHLYPFTIIFALWILIFYIAGLYDVRRLRNSLDFFQALTVTLIINAILSIGVFYVVPSFGITPKTNLFLFVGIFGILEFFWRRAFNSRLALRVPARKTLLLGNSGSCRELYEFINQNPQLGYHIERWTTTAPLAQNQLLSEVSDETSLVVAHPSIVGNPQLRHAWLSLMQHGVEIVDTISFMEQTARKIPLDDIDELWVIHNIPQGSYFYDHFKRGFEFIGAIVLAVVLIPLEIVIALAVKLTSAGPVLYVQERVKQNGTPYRHYKFRSMKTSAEEHGVAWKQSGSNDPRFTSIGKFLSRSHLDELAQLINIIAGDMSFVGPRPERPEFVAQLEKEIPFYAVRHASRPGITGWAQINFRYTSSIEDTKEKVSYDLYYLKNRSLILDIAIVIKTVKSFFINQQ